MMEDPQQRIGRPRQIYTGAPQRDYVPADAAEADAGIWRIVPAIAFGSPAFFCVFNWFPLHCNFTSEILRIECVRETPRVVSRIILHNQLFLMDKCTMVPLLLMPEVRRRADFPS